MAKWVNNDGLDVKFGTERAHSLADAGDYKTFNGAGESVVELEIDLAKLTTTETILSDVVWLPKNAQVTWVKSVAEVLGATGTSIDVGLVYTHATTGATTELDYDGLLAAFPLSDNYNGTGDTVTFYENTTVPASVTGTGALVGTILATTAERYYISASYAAGSAFTAGRLRLSIGYLPNATANN
jgi:hypothetical protein